MPGDPPGFLCCVVVCVVVRVCMRASGFRYSL